MTVAVDIDPQKPITTVAELQDHLRAATQVELSTIPLYLYAMYSIKARGESQWDAGMSAFRTIRSVVIEEMLHLCLARNVLLATGGEVTFYDKAFVPTYPSPMLHHSPDLILHLEPCSATLMRDVFMPLEKPAVAHAPPEPERYRTLGQFYKAIEDGLEKLDGPALWATPRKEFQYKDTYWNQDGGGSPVVVGDLLTARHALKIIVEQGEGRAPGDDLTPINTEKEVPGYDEYSHYEKFRRIAEGIDPIVNEHIDPAQGLWPVPTDPRTSSYEGDVRELAVLFNAAYCYVLKLIDALYAAPRYLVANEINKRYGLERTFIASMGGLLYPLADLLVRQPGPDGFNAAPTFEFHYFQDGSARQELIERATELLGAFPALGGPDGLLWLLAKLPEVD